MPVSESHINSESAFQDFLNLVGIGLATRYSKCPECGGVVTKTTRKAWKRTKQANCFRQYTVKSWGGFHFLVFFKNCLYLYLLSYLHYTTHPHIFKFKKGREVVSGIKKIFPKFSGKIFFILFWTLSWCRKCRPSFWRRRFFWIEGWCSVGAGFWYWNGSESRLWWNCARKVHIFLTFVLDSR